MLSEVCKDIEIEPKLTPFTGEELESRTANTMNEASLTLKHAGLGKRTTTIFRFKGFLTPTLAVISTSRCNSVT